MKVNMGSAEIQEVSGYKPVDKDLLAEIESLPIQSGGRTKPYVTWAKYLMYSLHGSSTIKFKSNGDTYKLDASEVVFQSLFFPEFTNQLELFRIEDKLILSSLNVENEKANNVLSSKEKRDRYSYGELKVFEPFLIRKSESIFEIDNADWTPEQRQTVNLRNSLIAYYNLTVYFDFTRKRHEPHPSAPDKPAKLSTWMERYDALFDSAEVIRLENHLGLFI